jgi:type I restriction enzyme S subunit
MKARCVKLRDVFSSMRFDGGYHNADVNVYDKVIRKHSQHTLDYYCSDIFTSGRTKRIYTEPEYGYPFLSNADVVSANPFQSCKYSSKKYGFDPNAVLKEGMILTGRVGAIGQTAFVPAFIEKAKAMGSDNIIRIVVKTSYRNGFIYAYLASKMGNLAFWKLATGGVQPFITDAMVGKLPIPVFPESFQAEVDNLIQESARLREEANDKLEEAQNKLSAFINVKFNKVNFKTSCVNFKEVMSSLRHRIDPPALMSDGVYSMKEVISKFTCKKICELKTKVFRPGIFKRIYVEEGIPYIKGSEIFLTDPFRRCVHLSKSRTPFVDEMTLHEGQILITCAGSVGDIKIITKDYEDNKAIGSQDIIRLESTDPLYTKEYLFTYLRQPFVYDYIQSMKYGSVIERIEPFHVESIPVVEPTEELSKQITSLIDEYMDSTYHAYTAENKAIKKVEDEIEKWNKAN